MDERRFEELVRDLVIALGAVDAHVVARRHDIGADIEAEFSVGHFATIPVRIQVKYWRDEAGRSPVDQLLNAMADVDFGMVVTTANFSDDVRQYAAECGEAAGKQLVLVDGDELCRLIVDYGLDALLARRVI
jgi:restriction endonuclease Mrr